MAIDRLIYALESNKIKPSDSTIVFAPGRINLIGEHTDYNTGLALPAAIEQGIYCAIVGANSSSLEALDRQETYNFCIEDDIESTKKSGWHNYLLGVISQLKESHGLSNDFRLFFCGDLPLGMGLSSSAALTNAVGMALNEHFNLGITDRALAYISQKSEHNFVGVKCGIMDQWASMFGKEGHTILLDFKTMSTQYHEFSLPKHNIVLVNSGINHSLAESEYNKRREECEAGVEFFKKQGYQVLSLRDVSQTMLQNYSDSVSPQILNRCSYVIEENLRVLEFVSAIQKKDIHKAGKIMYQGHLGLKEKYQVTCAETDFLVDQSMKISGVVGARQMGGGFGGCTINLVDKKSTTNFKAIISNEYERKYGIKAEISEVKIGDAARKLSFTRNNLL